MFNLDQMQQFVWAQFARVTEQWPPELKKAMQNIEVDVVKKEGRISVIAKSVVDDENTEKAKEILLTQLMHPISRVIGAFQCKVTTYK